MKELKNTNNVIDDIIVYRENKPFVRRALKDGRIDYLDLTEWTFTDKFFAFLLSIKFFEWNKSSFPTPRERECTPLWVLLSCIIQMKLHRTSAFLNLPGILRSGSILTRVGLNIGHKAGGFNYKNKKERKSIVNQDGVRKYFKIIEANKLENWYNADISHFIYRHRGFDKQGIFVIDGTFLVVPDNENYRYTVRMPLDEHDNLINLKMLSEEMRKSIKYKPCYKLTTLLHLSNADTEPVYIYGGVHLGPGNESELKSGEKLVDDFVNTLGKGIIKLLIVDRGFLSGKILSRFKIEHKIDTLIPIRSDMNILKDAIGLTRFPDQKWELYEEEKDKAGTVIKRREVCGFAEMTSWEECKVPLYVALMKEWGKGEEHIWGLISTKVFKQPHRAFDLYKLRTSIEERHKQLKESWNIVDFKSPDFNLDATHVIFTLLTYTLLQLYLSRKNLQKLANKTIDTLRKEEKLGNNAVIVYVKSYFATFSVREYTNILLALEKEPKIRLKNWNDAFMKDERKRSP
ncbi:transposase [bacterium]|nr:transposase [bacterium]